MHHQPLKQGSLDQTNQVKSSTELSLPHLAHELNNLLDSSLRAISLAQRTLRSADPESVLESLQVTENLNRAHRSLQTMAEVLERAMSVPSSAQQILHCPETLSQVVNFAVEQVSGLSQTHDVNLTVDIAPEVENLSGGSLLPILLNALRNAIQACVNSTERRVTLTVATDKTQQLNIVITDTGCGIPPDFAVGKTVNPQGHGLGLEIIQGIVTQLGGSMSLNNLPKRAGAQFQVQIPVKALSNHE